MFFKEKNIRPINLMNKADLFFKKDSKYLYSKKNTFIEVNCPACNSRKKFFLFKKNKFSYYSCLNCKTYYLNPRPKEKTLHDFYKNSKLYEYWNDYIFPSTEKVRNKKIFLPRVKKILEICKKFNVKKNRIIDIGAGYGTFCSIIKRYKFFNEVVALEPSLSGAKRCVEKKIKTLNIPIEAATYNDLKGTNVFTLFEVIEHIQNPYSFLKKIKKFTDKKSLVIFTCPNGMGFDISFLGKKSEAIDHEHLNYFNPQSIYFLAKRAGYKVMEIITPGVLDVDILKNKYESKKFTNINNFLLQVFDDEKKIKNLQNFLIRNKLSSNMWVVLKRND
jgi:2-polyprenyl-3-methyl-5-hydroxy-6-metoxy-1,4-benzoquinol methylase